MSRVWERTDLKTRMKPSPFLMYMSVKLVNCSIPCDRRNGGEGKGKSGE